MSQIERKQRSFVSSGQSLRVNGAAPTKRI
jgi:hypothetical protein